MNRETETSRHLGQFGSTGIGVGAIVGGGILALAGTAFAATGPSAVLAFALNGVIALITAMSFAELATSFPRSGGIYVFAKNVLAVDAAFTIGWVVWFASIAAGALYAIGFATFAVDILIHMGWFESHRPLWGLHERGVVNVLALGAVGFYSLRQSRHVGAGATHVENAVKVLIFAAIIAAGVWSAWETPCRPYAEAFRPLFPRGAMGFFQAMGFTFIALQGFDLIAAASGEIRQPRKTIPRAMFLSLGIALAIYLPLMILIPLAGVPPSDSLMAMCAEDPEIIIPVAAERFLGEGGFWLVMIAAVASMLSALGANLFAASRIALAMARDRTMPRLLTREHPTRRTPYAATGVTAALMALVILILPDIATAGAAASLVFLISFALVHWVTVLTRRRAEQADTFRTPWFPAIPVVGLVCCLALAVFQGLMVPRAGMLTALWLAVGGFVFLSLFARPARVVDARSAARNPELTRLRGRSPLVLVPVANPRNAGSLVDVANALTPPAVGRVLLLSVAVLPKSDKPPSETACEKAIQRSQEVLSRALTLSVRSGRMPEALTTLGSNPWLEIRRAAQAHRCEAILLGFGELGQEDVLPPLEELIRAAPCDVVVLRAEADWNLQQSQRILVPVGGLHLHDRLRARLLGSLLRTAPREITYLRVLSGEHSERQAARARRVLAEVAADEADECGIARVVESDDVPGALAEEIQRHDLAVIGTHRVSRQNRAIGPLLLSVARRTTQPMLIISQRE